MTHRGPQTATREKDKIIHLHFGNTYMHIHACARKKASRDTNLKVQREANETESKLSAEDTNTWMAESAKPWAAPNIRAALLCNFKVSCHFKGAQTHILAGNAASIRIKNSNTYVKCHFVEV